jgi:hypothetical protein
MSAVELCPQDQDSASCCFFYFVGLMGYFCLGEAGPVGNPNCKKIGK